MYTYKRRLRVYGFGVKLRGFEDLGFVGFRVGFRFRGGFGRLRLRVLRPMRCGLLGFRALRSLGLQGSLRLRGLSKLGMQVS